MDKVVNPWTGKSKQKGEGLLNTIIEKHFPYKINNNINSNEVEFEKKLLKMMQSKIKPKNKIG